MEPSGLRIVRLLVILHRLNCSLGFSPAMQWEERTSPAVGLWLGFSSHKRSMRHVLIRVINSDVQEARRGSRVEIHGGHETAFCARRGLARSVTTIPKAFAYTLTLFCASVWVYGPSHGHDPFGVNNSTQKCPSRFIHSIDRRVLLIVAECRARRPAPST